MKPEKDRAARMHEHSNRPVLRKRLCQTNLLQALPAGASRVASIFAASLIGLKGVLNPKVQVKTHRGVTLQSQFGANVH